MLGARFESAKYLIYITTSTPEASTEELDAVVEELHFAGITVNAVSGWVSS